MSSRKASTFKTLSFKLTFWFALIFTGVSVAVGSLAYVFLSRGAAEDMDNLLRSEAWEMSDELRMFGLASLSQILSQEAEAHGRGRMFFKVFSPTLELVASSDLSAWEGLRTDKDILGELSSQGEVVFTTEVPGVNDRVRIIYRLMDNGFIIQAGHTVSIMEILGKYGPVLFAAFAVMLLSGSIAGYSMVRGALRGVERVRQAAVRLGDGDFDQRLPLGFEGQEIDRLAESFNEMLDKIDSLVSELKQVTANIAHDLKSPLSRLRSAAEMALTGEPTPEEWRELAGNMVEESDRLVAMINTMLEIAQANAGTADYASEPVNLVQLTRDAFELYDPVAEDAGIELDFAAKGDTLMVLGDEQRLKRVVANLLDNAFKYTPEGGRVRVSVSGTAAEAVLSISDSGRGISPDDLPHVFDRFFRGDRSRSTPGSGLGLSLVKAIAGAHGGKVEVRSKAGEGSVFIVRLPRAS